jgi:glutaredoxin
MRVATRLFQACRITFFTRDGCKLCTDAKQTLSDVWDVRPFVYREINVMKPDQTMWRNLYEFDTPVVSISRVIKTKANSGEIHVANASSPEEDPELSGKAKKLMHRFSAEEVQKKMDNVEALP